jgi:hypothetical protein
MAQYKTVTFAEFDQRVQAFTLPPDFDQASVSREVAEIANGWRGQGTIRLVYDESTNVLTEVQHLLPQGGNYQWVWQTGWTPQQVRDQQPPPPPPDEDEQDEAQGEDAPRSTSGWTAARPSAGRTQHTQIGVRGLVDDEDEANEGESEQTGGQQVATQPQTAWDEWVQLPATFDDMWTTWQGWPQFRQYAASCGYGNDIEFLEAVFAYDQSPSQTSAIDIMGRYLLPDSSQRIAVANQVSTDYQNASSFEAGLFAEAEQADRAYVAQVWDLFVAAYQARHGQ